MSSKALRDGVLFIIAFVLGAILVFQFCNRSGLLGVLAVVMFVFDLFMIMFLLSWIITECLINNNKEDKD